MFKQEMREVWNEAELRESILQSELERFIAQYQFPVQLKSNIALHFKVSYTECSEESPLLSTAYSKKIMQTKPLQGLIWLSYRNWIPHRYESHTPQGYGSMFFLGEWGAKGRRMGAAYTREPLARQKPGCRSSKFQASIWTSRHTLFSLKMWEKKK